MNVCLTVVTEEGNELSHSGYAYIAVLGDTVLVRRRWLSPPHINTVIFRFKSLFKTNYQRSHTVPLKFVMLLNTLKLWIVEEKSPQ